MGNRSVCGKACTRCAADCAKVTMPSGGEGDFFDEHLACDPAGAIFEETLEDLNDVDRQLLLFSSASNLAAVRWLFVLGASRDVCDSNGTTCLHAACRSGTLQIVKDLASMGLPLDLTDISGWTALHIAIFMGRRDVVLFLLQAGAQLHKKNLKGQTPLEMCSDSWTREAIRSYMLHQKKASEKPWVYERELDAQQDSVASTRLRYEPFFVPRAPVLQEPVYKQEFQKFGQRVFDKRPGQGLAFLVAAGCTRDYPVDMSAFLRRSRVDLAQIGSFLGEAFSLSQTLRLEFINSVKLQGTGVVSSLAKVFMLLHIPPDLQKIDRLVHGVARIWWRQHEKLSEQGVDPRAFNKARRNQEGGSEGSETSQERELEGFELKQYFCSPDSLYQLMFSAVMLHWNLYAPIPSSQRMSFSRWLEVNRGIEGSGGNIPVHVQKLIYQNISRGFTPQLQIRRSGDAPGGQGESKEGAGGSAMADLATLEGWARLVGGTFPSMAGLSGTVTYTHISSVLSEATTGAAMPEPVEPAKGATPRNGSRGSGAPGAAAPLASPPPALPPEGGRGPQGRLPMMLADARGKDQVWLSLVYTLLCFSASPSDDAPYALVHLRRLVIKSVDPASLSLTLVGGTDNDDNQSNAEGGGPNGDSLSRHDSQLVKLIFLLPDGRWQSFDLPELKFQVADVKQLERWTLTLTEVCGEPQEPSRLPAGNATKKTPAPAALPPAPAPGSSP